MFDICYWAARFPSVENKKAATMMLRQVLWLQLPLSVFTTERSHKKRDCCQQASGSLQKPAPWQRRHSRGVICSPAAAWWGIIQMPFGDGVPGYCVSINQPTRANKDPPTQRDGAGLRVELVGRNQCHGEVTDRAGSGCSVRRLLPEDAAVSPHRHPLQLLSVAAFWRQRLSAVGLTVRLRSQSLNSLPSIIALSIISFSLYLPRHVFPDNCPVSDRLSLKLSQHLSGISFGLLLFKWTTNEVQKVWWGFGDLCGCSKDLEDTSSAHQTSSLYWEL